MEFSVRRVNRIQAGGFLFYITYGWVSVTLFFSVFLILLPTYLLNTSIVLALTNCNLRHSVIKLYVHTIPIHALTDLSKYLEHLSKDFYLIWGIFEVIGSHHLRCLDFKVYVEHIQQAT